MNCVGFPTQDIKMGSCVFQCDIPHQWIAQRKVGYMPIYCGRLECHVQCLRHGIPVWQHIGQKYHCYKQAPSRYYRTCLKATLNPNTRLLDNVGNMDIGQCVYITILLNGNNLRVTVIGRCKT